MPGRRLPAASFIGHAEIATLQKPTEWNPVVPSRENSPSEPLIVGVVPEQPPEIITQAALLAEQLVRTIVFVCVEPRSQSSDWNLTLRMTDVPIPPLNISEDMSAYTTGIFAAICSFMSGNATRWMLRVVRGRALGEHDEYCSRKARINVCHRHTGAKVHVMLFRIPQRIDVYAVVDPAALARFAGSRGKHQE